MLSLQKFERLIDVPLAIKPITLSLIGQHGEKLSAWSSGLARLDKHEQYRQIKTVLSELTIAQMDDEHRFTLLKTLVQQSERLIVQMHNEYVNSPQSQSVEQKTYMEEVRSLYFLQILGFLGIAYRLYGKLNQEGLPAKKSAPHEKSSWLDKIMGGLSSNVVRNGANINILDKIKTTFTLSVWHIMATCYKLLFEFAIAYQKAPDCLWKIMNAWYLKSATVGVDRLDVAKMSDMPSCCINHQYMQCCSVSFANFFAYRRADIVNIFKIFPEWTKLVKSTFVAKKQYRVFVNLQSSSPPEIINPHASINPYSGEVVCLFFDTSKLFGYLKSLQTDSNNAAYKNGFESRLAKILLLVFDREAEETFSASKVHNRYVDVRIGFGAIFKEIMGQQSFAQLIVQSALLEEYRPKRLLDIPLNVTEERAKLIRTSESGGTFVVEKANTPHAEQTDIVLHPFLSVFSLFALKMPQAEDKHLWRLGIIHWVQDNNGDAEVDGKFLGRILSVCGVRLGGHDMRSKDFVQALLVAGDGLNKQTTLILPRYHFKAGDTVILRVANKQTTLRLEQNLLSTDDIEQYQIVRLA